MTPAQSPAPGSEILGVLAAKIANGGEDHWNHYDDSSKKEQWVVHFFEMSAPSDKIAETHKPMYVPFA